MNDSIRTKQEPIPYGYVWLNGIVLSDTCIDAYNRYTNDINRASHPDTIETLLNHRHQYLVIAMSEAV